MSISALVWFSLAMAAVPACLFVFNLFFYRAPLRISPEDLFPVSILIPARNEERSIEASLRTALASRNLDLEVIVLDDQSEDRTAEIVRKIAASDSRVRLAAAPPLPANWCGKQHACHVLSTLASKATLCFIDADVRVSATGVARMVQTMAAQGAALISGFPRQDTRTFFEQLLIPLMHFLLLGYLPMIGMRKSLHPAYGAGCGQIFVAQRAAYLRAGGHAAIRTSRHDGITLPRAFRRAGLKTDLCDATSVATCRMYSNAREVWNGLLKNATEGLASPGRIIPFSILLFVGQVLPVGVLAYCLGTNAGIKLEAISALAVLCSYLPRLISVLRFKQPLLTALCHPLAIFILLAIQWSASLRSLLGRPSTWKGRSYSTTYL